MLINLFVPNLMIVFGPGPLLKYLKKWYLNKQIDKKDPNLDINQRMANELYEKDNFDIALKYTIICKTLSLTMFYLPMMPIVVVYGLLTMIIEFYMTKFILYKRSNSKTKYSSHISRNMTNEFELCLFLYTLGLMVSEYMLNFESIQEYKFNKVTTT